MTKNKPLQSVEKTLELLDVLDLGRIFPSQLPDPKTLVPTVAETGHRRPGRPQNAFFICRQNVIREAKRVGVSNMRLISKAASILWKNASECERNRYRQLAAEVRALHRQRFPGYRYTPARQESLYEECGFSPSSSFDYMSATNNAWLAINNISSPTMQNATSTLSSFEAILPQETFPSLDIDLSNIAIGQMFNYNLSLQENPTFCFPFNIQHTATFNLDIKETQF